MVGSFLVNLKASAILQDELEFREKRYSFRKRNKTIKGLDLTNTLNRYAQTGKEYTEILEQIIKQNDLSDFETVQLTNSVLKKDIAL